MLMPILDASHDESNSRFLTKSFFLWHQWLERNQNPDTTAAAAGATCRQQNPNQQELEHRSWIFCGGANIFEVCTSVYHVSYEHCR